MVSMMGNKDFKHEMIHNTQDSNQGVSSDQQVIWNVIKYGYMVHHWFYSIINSCNYCYIINQ